MGYQRRRRRWVVVPLVDGSLSGRGHGWFWLAPGRVVVAHRFAYALVRGVAATAAVAVPGQRCDNPLCQRVGWGTWWPPRMRRTGARGRSGAPTPVRNWVIPGARGSVRGN